MDDKAGKANDGDKFNSTSAHLKFGAILRR